MIRKLAHLAFDTDDLDRMVAFYTKGLGMTLQFTLDLDDGAPFGCYIACGDTSFIEIFDRVGKSKKWGGDVQAPRQGNQYTHFSLEVTNLRDYREQLIAKGIDVGGINEGMDHSLQAWTRDPDGNAIEFMEYTWRSMQLERKDASVKA